MQNTLKKSENIETVVNAKKLLDFIRLAKKANKGERLQTIHFKRLFGLLQVVVANRTIQVLQEFTVTPGGEGKNCTVEMRVLEAMLKTYKKESINLTWNNSVLTIISEKGNINTIANQVDVIFFPQVIDLDTLVKYPIDGLSFLKGLEMSGYVVEEESPRNYGTVLCFDNSKDNYSTLVGTDGYRLAFSKFDKIVDMPNICLSKKAIDAIAYGFAGDLEFYLDSSNTTAFFVQGDIRLSVRLSNVNYPKYERVIPACLMVITVNRMELLNFVERALLFSDKSKAVKFKIDNNILYVGELKTDQRIKLSHSVKPREFSLNGKFVTDCLKTYKNETITIGFAQNNDAPVSFILGENRTVIVPIQENK